MKEKWADGTGPLGKHIRTDGGKHAPWLKVSICTGERSGVQESEDVYPTVSKVACFSLTTGIKGTLSFLPFVCSSFTRYSSCSCDGRAGEEGVGIILIFYNCVRLVMRDSCARRAPPMLSLLIEVVNVVVAVMMEFFMYTACVIVAELVTSEIARQ